MKFSDKKKLIAVLFSIFGLCVILFCFVQYLLLKNELANLYNKEVLVVGNSLYPYLRNGDKVLVDFSYQSNYAKKINRDEVVIADFSKSYKDKMIKFVKVVPGDKFHADENSMNLYINGKPMTNSRGDIMRLNKAGIGMIKFYEEDFRGVMPSGVYFIFGDHSNTLDSGRFGTITRKDIMGKMIKKIK